MDDVILHLDATFGSKVKIGDRIKTGQEVGKDSDSDQIVVSPMAGVISSITFNPENHTFVVVIKAE